MHTTHIRPPALLLCVVCLSIPLSSGAAPAVFEGRDAWLDPARVHVPDAELAFTDAPAPHFRNEALYITGRFDNGCVFTTGFFGWRVGVLRGYGAYALIGRPDGSRIWALRQLRRDEIRIETGRFAVSAEGIRFAGGDGRYEVLFTKDGFSLDFELDAVLPAWRPGDGLSRLTDDETAFTRLAMPFPWATIEGTLTVEGRTTAVRGEAYSDSTLTVLPSNRLPPETACFRAWSPPGTPEAEKWFVSVVEYVSHPATGSIRQRVLLLARGSEWVLTTPLLTLEREGLTDAPLGAWPARYLLRAEDQGYLLTGEYRAQTHYETTDMLAEVPAVFRGLVSLFTQRSVNFRSIGTFSGTLTDPEGRSYSLELSGLGEYLVVR